MKTNKFVCDVCTQVLELLSEGGEAAFDTMCLLRTLGQVRTDMVDRKQAQTANGNAEKEISEMKGMYYISKVKIRHLHFLN